MPIFAEFHDQESRDKGPKAILLDYDALNFADYGPDDTCLYCLTNKQVQIILALLPYVGWKTRWFSPTETTIDTDLIERIEADLAARLMADVCTEIMDKLTALDEKLDTIVGKEDTILSKEDTIIAKQDALHGLMEADTAALEGHLVAQDVLLGGLLSEMTGIIEPSIALLAAAIAGIASDVSEIGDDVDNIETIITDADDGLVEVSQDVDNIELVVAKLKNSVTNITNNTIINLTFGIPDQTFSSDSKDITATETYARYNALCSAVVNWIYAEGYAVMSALDAPATDLATIAAQIDAFANSLQYSMTGFSGSYIISEIYGALNDTTAVNDLACIMIDNLKDLAPTAYSFQSALNGYTPPAYPDNHKILYDTLAIAIADLNGWQTFASLFQPAFDDALAANPTAYDCPPCGTFPDFCGIPQTWDFRLGVKAPWLIHRGILVPGKGIVGVQVPGDLNFGIDVSLTFATPCTSIIGHDWAATLRGLPTGVGNTHKQEKSYLLSGVETIYNNSTIGGMTWPTPTLYHLGLNAPPGSAGIYKLRFFSNSPYMGGTQGASAVELQKMELLS